MANPDAQDWRSQDGRITFMYFSNEYLSVATPLTGIWPVFPQPTSFSAVFHQFAMILGIGHAAVQTAFAETVVCCHLDL